MNNNVDWIIHLVANGACDECGKEEKGFLPYTCNAHTHGMEKYGHPDFQVVLSLPPREIGRILNTLCCVQSYRIGRIAFRKIHSAKNHIDCRVLTQRNCMSEKVCCRENCHLPDCDRAR